MQTPRERDMMKQWTKRTPPQIDSTTKYCILLYRDALEEEEKEEEENHHKEKGVEPGNMIGENSECIELLELAP